MRTAGTIVKVQQLNNKISMFGIYIFAVVIYMICNSHTKEEWRKILDSIDE